MARSLKGPLPFECNPTFGTAKQLKINNFELVNFVGNIAIQ